MIRKTKIICTLGPAVDSDEMIRALIENGMDCARCNFSHGTHEEQKMRMDRVKRVRKELGREIPILLDTKGPEIRVKDFENGSTILEEGQDFILTTGELLGTKEKVALTYGNLYKYAKIGTRILIDDGKIAIDVKEISGKDLVCKVVNGGKISNHKSINIPNIVIPMPYINEADKSDILFGIEQEVDFIAASFVRSADDIKKLRSLLHANGGDGIQVIAKIENLEGIHNLEEIIDLSDGIMVARGDLGVEIPFKHLPALQKDMIERCYRKGKHVITATQMLESMTQNPRPTRAEVSDVANAIYDGTTVIMLSGESAAGEYPIEAVRTMAEIAKSTEDSINYEKRFMKRQVVLEKSFPNAIAMAACLAANHLNAKAIIVVSRSGRTAQMIADYRPNCGIIAAIVSERGTRQLNLAFGVRAVPAEEQQSADLLFEHAVQKAKETAEFQKGDTVVIVAGETAREAAPSNMLKIYQM